MKRVTEAFAVTGQLTPADIERAAADGVRSVINNRPDGEEDGQPTAAECASRAQELGLVYYHVPTPGVRLDPAAVEATRRVLAEAEAPVLAHCRTGTRSLALWLVDRLRAGDIEPGDVEGVCRHHQCDPQAVHEWLYRSVGTDAVAPRVEAFFDADTFSAQYVVRDPASNHCAIIDPVLDYDPNAAATDTCSADALLAHVQSHGLVVDWILDTHPHADHFSAAHYLREQTGAPMAIGEHIVDVQALWKDLYDLGSEMPADGSQWDRLFAAGDTFRIGTLDAHVLFSPGHTLASVTYVIGDAAFVHDTLFMPDFGTARADFPGGNAAELWHSIQQILALPDDTRLYVGHDYRPNGRAPRFETSVAEQKAHNPHLQPPIDEAAFVELRNERDRQLPMPRLILHALQINIRGGRLPEPAANGRRYLRIPLDSL